VPNSAASPLDAPYTTTVHLAAGDTIEQIVATYPVPPMEGPTVVLPSSLRHADRLAAALRSRLRRSGYGSRLLVPGGGIVPLARAISGGQWSWITITPPDLPPSQVRLPAPLAAAASAWIVTDVDAVRDHGPFVLDLLARYLHPLDRVRLLASPRREEAIADLNLALAGPDVRFLVAMRISDAWLAAWTVDIVSAELLALAMADEGRQRGGEVTGPWEERVVQRATELELGIRLPSDLVVRWINPPTEPQLQLAERVLMRIGVTPP
jgi:hypothetical protein